MNLTSKKYCDTLTIAGRCLLLSKRNPDTFLTSIMLPALMMALFVSLFGNLIRVNDTPYLNYIIPGVLVQCIAQNSSTTAIMMHKDTASGITARFSILPIRTSAILNGHITEALARSILTSLTVLLIAIVLGFRPALSLRDAGILLLLLIGITMMLSWLAIAVGIAANSSEGASALSALAIILPYLSSGFVPIETLPEGIRIFARYQPLTPIIDTMRNALTGSPLEAKTLATALLWCAGLTVAFSFLSLKLFHRQLQKL